MALDYFLITKVLNVICFYIYPVQSALFVQHDPSSCIEHFLSPKTESLLCMQLPGISKPRKPFCSKRTFQKHSSARTDERNCLIKSYAELRWTHSCSNMPVFPTFLSFKRLKIHQGRFKELSSYQLQIPIKPSINRHWQYLPAYACLASHKLWNSEISLIIRFTNDLICDDKISVEWVVESLN